MFRIFKTISGATLLCVAVTAQAQQTSSTKQATNFKDLVSGQTADIQLRNYIQEEAKKDQPYSDDGTTKVITQVRGNYTVKTFSDKVASTLTLGAYTGSSDNGVVTQRRPRLLTEVDAYDSSYFSLVPYLDLHGPQNANGTRGDLGFIPKIKHPAIATAFGDFTASLHAEAEAQFKSRPEDSSVNKRYNEDGSSTEGFGLVKDDEGKVVGKKDEKGLVYEVMYVPQVGLDMNRIVKGLKVYSYVEYTNTYEPIINEPATEEGREGGYDRKYVPVRNTDTYLGLSYQVSEKLTFVNEFYTGHAAGNGQLYSSRGDADGVRYGNIAMLSYTMF